LPGARTSSFGGATGSDLRACASIYMHFWFSSVLANISEITLPVYVLLGLHPMEK